MFGKFLPRSTDFFVFFEKHADVVVLGALELKEMMGMPPQEHREKANRIAQLENEADAITHQCIEALHSTFITPFERSDIYRLITKMDDILDTIEDVAARIVLYKLDTGQKKVIEIADVLCLSAKEIQKLVFVLREKKTPSNTQELFSQIHKLESKADSIVRQSLGILFDEEKDIFALIKWKEIYENLEAAIDDCESAANIIEGVMIENS